MSLFAELSKISVYSKFHDSYLTKSVSWLYTVAMPCDNSQEKDSNIYFMSHESVLWLLKLSSYEKIMLSASPNRRENRSAEYPKPYTLFISRRVEAISVTWPYSRIRSTYSLL